jgi:NAD(P)-dependent dehydrogenase (short-subunit alcohol dehydrogenase family)
MARVLITGTSRGIGRATAFELARRGHDVIATARDVSALEDVPAVLRLSLDVTDQESVDAALAEAGRVDVLVSNAGDTLRAAVESVPLSEVERIFQLNTFGALRVTQGVLPGMRERGSGKVIFVSSVQGRIVIPLIGTYAASKWALEALAETLAIEAGHFGVTVQLIQPGAVASDGAARAHVHVDEDSPYRPLLDQLAGFRGELISLDDVATAIASAVDDSNIAFRIPVGATSAGQLIARKSAPEDLPFVAAPLRW